ncbi:MAG: hypothetical protein NHF89_00190 [Candidatus Shikimatogenerans bostrichidophilus]|nr:MAG: hypothetical protein NHF89_00190 [Candidatus Shikimatogenerans bostrichidophilus]
MKLFITPLKTKKSIYMFIKYNIYTFILNKKNINKIKLKEYFYKNYLLRVKRINFIKLKKKTKNKYLINKLIKGKIKFIKKIMVKFYKTNKNIKFLLKK